MVGGKQVGRKKQKLLGSHQKCWVWGRHAVSEILQTDHWIPLEVWIADTIEADVAEGALSSASRLDVTVERKSDGELTRRCGSLEHQGLMAKMPPFPYRTLTDVIEGASQTPLILVLDRVQDPHNLGAIIRSAEVFGVDGIVIGTRSQCGVTAAVVRSSAGAIIHVPVAQVDDLAAAVCELSRRSIHVVSSSAESDIDLTEADFRQPAALLIGNEGTGIDAALLEASDIIIRIPQSGRVGSLNAAVAAGILLYEARRQRA